MSTELEKIIVNCDQNGVVNSSILEQQFGKDFFKKDGSFIELHFSPSTKEIDWFVFSNASRIVKIVFPPELKRIYLETFKDCKNLVEVQFGDKIELINASAFEGCAKLKEVRLPPSVSTIDDQAFKDCSSLSKVEARGLEYVGEMCFYQCECLEEVDIPALKQAAAESFYCCSKIKNISFAEGAEIGPKAFLGCLKLESISFEGEAVLDDAAFASCKSLKKVDFSNVVKMGTGVFQCCESLEEIDFTSSELNYIYKCCFHSCHSLKTVRGLNDIKSLYDFCFADCTSLKELDFSSGEERCISGYDNVFDGCTSLERIVLTNAKIVPGGYPENRPFNGLGSKAMLIGVHPNDYESYIALGVPSSQIEGYQGEEKGERVPGVEEISLLGKLEYYPDDYNAFVSDGFNIHDFLDVDMDDFHIPSSWRIKHLGSYRIDRFPFQGLKHLRKVSLNKVIKEKINNCFCDCPALEEIIFEKGFSALGKGNFKNCPNIKSFSIPETMLDIDKSNFEGSCANDGNGAYYLGDLLMKVEKNLQRLVVKEGTKAIFPSACKASDLEEVRFPSSLVSIGKEAFKDCEKLKSINIPSSVVYIGKDAFSRKGEPLAQLRSVRGGRYINNHTFVLYGEPVQIQEGIIKDFEKMMERKLLCFSVNHDTTHDDSDDSRATCGSSSDSSVRYREFTPSKHLKDLIVYENKIIGVVLSTSDHNGYSFHDVPYSFYGDFGGDQFGYSASHSSSWYYVSSFTLVNKGENGAPNKAEELGEKIYDQDSF